MGTLTRKMVTDLPLQGGPLVDADPALAEGISK